MSGLTPETFLQRLPLSNQLRRVGAVALAGLAFATGMASESKPAAANPIPLSQCATSVGVPGFDCRPDGVPATCLAAAAPEMAGLSYQPYQQKWGKKVAHKSTVGRVLLNSHPIESTIQDQGNIVGGINAAAYLYLGREMGATRMRIIKSAGETDAQDDVAITQAENNCDYKVEVTLDCDGNKQSQAFYEYIEAEARHFIQLGVDRLGICNEPDLSLRPASYLRLFRLGSEAVQAVDQALGTRTEVVFGDFSPIHRPLRYEDKIWSILLRERKSGHNFEPIIAHAEALHPYSFFRRGIHNVPKMNRRAQKHDWTVGVTRIKLWEKDIVWAYRHRLFMTPDGKLPPIDIDEFSPGQHEAKGGYAKLNIPETIRAKFGARVWSTLCQDPRIREIAQYQIGPRPSGWEGQWGTGIVSEHGQLLPTYYALSGFASTHPQCVKQPA